MSIIRVLVLISKFKYQWECYGLCVHGPILCTGSSILWTWPINQTLDQRLYSLTAIIRSFYSQRAMFGISVEKPKNERNLRLTHLCISLD